MNGRVYDPTLGRFLSADPHIQSPYSTQSYNRYSYVSNNPLKYTDPSGYFLGGLFKSVFKAIRNVVKSVLRAVGSIPIIGDIAKLYVCQGNPACYAALSAATTYAITGDLGLAAKVGITSYVGAQLAESVGSQFKFTENPVANVIGNGAIGGVMSKAQGGRFKDGFLASAFAASMKGFNFKAFDSKPMRVVVAGVIGGTASVLGGGKFANGAASAMFTQMYNAEEHIDELEGYDGYYEADSLNSSDGLLLSIATAPIGAGAVVAKGTWQAFKSLFVTPTGFGGNPFKGKTFKEIDKILRGRGFTTKGTDPVKGEGSYFHPDSGRKYYLDKGGKYRQGTELPHVDVHRMKNGSNLRKEGKRRYPLGDKLIEPK